jgi:hypothetical protein
MSWNYHWRTSPAVSVLEQAIDQLRTENIRLRRDLTNKTGYAGRLEVLLRSRTERIDELANTVATLRDQNRRLNEEADHLAEMVRMSPGDAP